MPTYDYRCDKCGNEFEDFLPMAKRAEPTKSPCEKDVGVDEQVLCGGKIDQVLSSTPIAFAGLAYDNTLSMSSLRKASTSDSLTSRDAKILVPTMQHVKDKGEV